MFATISLCLRGDSPAEVEKIVARLDTEYQAAAKANDPAPMDRILADDFVLVTGKGQAFGKASGRRLRHCRPNPEAGAHGSESADIGTPTESVKGSYPEILSAAQVQRGGRSIKTMSEFSR